MAGADASTAGRLARMGMPLIDPSQGLAALGAVLSGPHMTHRAAVAAVPFDWPTFMKKLPPGQSGIFADFELPPSTAGSAGPAQRALSHPPQKKKSASASATGHLTKAVRPTAASAVVQEQVSAAVASVLGMSVTADASLMESGLDSLASVELRNALSQQLELQIPATFVLDYPTITAMAAFIKSLIIEVP